MLYRTLQTEVKQQLMYDLFLSCFSGANAGNPSLPDIAGGQVGGGVATANLPALDMQWVESRAKKAALKLEKLDTDLKNSKVRLFLLLLFQ